MKKERHKPWIVSRRLHTDASTRPSIAQREERQENEYRTQPTWDEREEESKRKRKSQKENDKPPNQSGAGLDTPPPSTSSQKTCSQQNFYSPAPQLRLPCPRASVLPSDLVTPSPSVGRGMYHVPQRYPSDFLCLPFLSLGDRCCYGRCRRHRGPRRRRKCILPARFLHGI